jgi:hypothetical protein
VKAPDGCIASFPPFTAVLQGSADTKRNPAIKRLLIGVYVALPLGLIFSPLARAAWSAGGSGSASALAYTMPSGNQPAVSVSGTSGILTWSTALFPDHQIFAGCLSSGSTRRTVPRPSSVPAAAEL